MCARRLFAGEDGTIDLERRPQPRQRRAPTDVATALAATVPCHPPFATYFFVRVSARSRVSVGLPSLFSFLFLLACLLYVRLPSSLRHRGRRWVGLVFFEQLLPVPGCCRCVNNWMRKLFPAAQEVGMGGGQCFWFQAPTTLDCLLYS